MDLVTWLAVGLSVGGVMGLTGAGGALVAVPIFISGMGTTVHEATQFSLWAVFLGSILNAWIARSEVRWHWAAVVIPLSWTASHWVQPYKAALSPTQISWMIIAVATWSLVTLWRKPRTSKKTSSLKKIPPQLLPIGLAVGTLNTLTGLGGGAILVPSLLRIHPTISPTLAMSTSLGIIVGSSAGSLWIQRALPPSWEALEALGIGLFVAAWAARAVLRMQKPQTADRIRKVAFTCVVAGTVTSLLV